VGEFVAHLVAEHAGQFGLVAQKGHELAHHVDAAARHAERIQVGLVGQPDLNVRLLAGHSGQNALGHRIEVPVQLFVVNDAEFSLALLGDHVAEVDFLLSRKDVRLFERRNGGRRLAGLLGLKRAGANPLQCEHEAHGR
jgi:hypothetical protein